MRLYKVKILGPFSYKEDLEKKLNEFLNGHEVGELVDIKHIPGQQPYEAMVIYIQKS